MLYKGRDTITVTVSLELSDTFLRLPRLVALSLGTTQIEPLLYDMSRKGYKNEIMKLKASKGKDWAKAVFH